MHEKHIRKRRSSKQPPRNPSTKATLIPSTYNNNDRSLIVSGLFLSSDEPTGRLAVVFELMEQNLYEAIKGRKNYISEKKIKWYMYQLLKALDYMHRSGVFHRDIKP
jgi:serine/threonine protein kinase